MLVTINPAYGSQVETLQLFRNVSGAKVFTGPFAPNVDPVKGNYFSRKPTNWARHDRWAMYLPQHLDD